jgi:hypothetical protein
MLTGFQVIVEWLDTAVLGVTARIGVVVEPLRQISPAAIHSLGVSKMARSTASRGYNGHRDGLRPGAVLRIRHTRTGEGNTWYYGPAGHCRT